MSFQAPAYFQVPFGPHQKGAPNTSHHGASSCVVYMRGGASRRLSAWLVSSAIATVLLAAASTHPRAEAISSGAVVGMRYLECRDVDSRLPSATCCARCRLVGEWRGHERSGAERCDDLKHVPRPTRALDRPVTRRRRFPLGIRGGGRGHT